MGLYIQKQSTIFIIHRTKFELEQIERLHSEIPPAAPWLPTLVIHIRSQDKVKVTHFKKLPKIQILKFGKKLHMRHIFWSYLIRYIDMKWIRPELYALQSGHGMPDRRMDGRTNRRTEWNQYTPQQLRCAKGIIIFIHICCSNFSDRSYLIAIIL